MRNVKQAFNRRRLLQVVGTVGAGAYLSALGKSARALPTLWVWRGRALGAAASIRLYHPEAAAARSLLERCAGEIRRLDAIFSLYQPQSALCRLNAAGRLEAPPLDLVRLLSEAARFSRASNGVFDVTVQPLWERHAAHDWSQPAPGLPPVADLLPLIDWRKLEIEPSRIAFARRGMAVTLNGIAQGYITDRLIEFLRDAGCGSVLADVGEIRGLGRTPDGRPWRVGYAEEGNASLEVVDGAVASSSAAGTVFEPSGGANHLFDPRSGRSVPAGRAVTVTAPNATLADALSTTLAIGDETVRPGLLAAFPGSCLVRTSVLAGS